MRIVLGIESSCDETAVCLLEAQGDASSAAFKILGNALYSQVAIHKEYGGVFPALAKREHQKKLPTIFEKTLREAKTKIEQINLIAVTTGPGLEPARVVGLEHQRGRLEVPVPAHLHAEHRPAGLRVSSEGREEVFT